MSEKTIQIYTDGSCQTQLKIGGWAAIIITDGNQIVLEGTVNDTSHNRMELLAVLKAFDYLISENINFDKVLIYSDSQYVVNLTERRKSLKQNLFHTAKGTPIRNSDLIQKLIDLLERYPLNFIKVAAHQKETDMVNFNRLVDKKARKLVRDKVKSMK